jgi:hypothetical protein
LYLYSFLNLCVDVVGDQRHAPAALPQGKTRYPLYRRLGGHHGRFGRVWKISPPTGFDPLPLVKSNGKAIPLEAWICPEGFRRLRLPDFKTVGT